jgi:hypothetical protein
MKSILMLVSGVLCIAGGLLHGSGLRVIHGEMVKASASGDLTRVLDLAWVFMSMAILTFGAILLTYGLQMRKKSYGGRAPAAWVAACLTLFSGGAIILLGYNSHFLYFLIVGVVAAFACVPDQKAA